MPHLGVGSHTSQRWVGSGSVGLKWESFLKEKIITTQSSMVQNDGQFSPIVNS